MTNRPAERLNVACTVHMLDDLTSASPHHHQIRTSTLFVALIPLRAYRKFVWIGNEIVHLLLRATRLTVRMSLSHHVQNALRLLRTRTTEFRMHLTHVCRVMEQEPVL